MRKGVVGIGRGLLSDRVPHESPPGGAVGRRLSTRAARSHGRRVPRTTGPGPRVTTPRQPPPSVRLAKPRVRVPVRTSVSTRKL